MTRVVSNESGEVILVAVDFSASSESALLLGAKLAAGSATPLVVLHVAHDPADHPGTYPRTGPQDLLLPLSEIAVRMLDEYVESMRQKHPEVQALAEVRKVVVGGIPETRIVEVAERLSAKAILVGSHSRSGLAKLLSGSVSEKVAQHSRIPVTVVHSHEEAWDCAGKTPAETRPATEGPLTAAAH